MSELTGFRLSPVQRRLWRLGASAPGFCVQCVLAVPREADVETLRQRLTRAAGRETIFRTRFQRVAGLSTPIQTVADEGSVAWQEIDPGDRANDTEYWLERERQTPVDLERGPIVRAMFGRTAEGPGILVLTIPALCADVATLTTLVSEIAGAVHDAGLPFTQFAEWQNECEHAPAQPDAVTRWAASTPPAPEAVRLAQQDRPAGAQFTPRFRSFCLPKDLADGIRDVSHAQRVGPESALLACWQHLLWTLTRCDDLFIGVEATCRDDQMLAELCGPVARHIPQPLCTTPDKAFTTAIRDVDAELQEHRRWGLYYTSDIAEPFPFTFAWHDWPGDPSTGSDGLTMLARYACAERFGLQLTCINSGADLFLQLGYDATRFSADTPDEMFELLVAMLARAVEQPDRAMDSLGIVSGCVRERVLLLSAGETRPIRDDSLADLFECQARQTPDRVAVSDAAQRLTYAALNDAADDVAHALHDLGIGTDDLVGLLADRSCNAIVGLIGILKAGAAFVPIDPVQSANRSNAALADARIRAIVGHHSSLPGGDRWPTVPLPLARVSKGADAAVARDTARATGTLAYAIFTSGSSGRPKAVAIEQRSVLNLLDSLNALVYEELPTPLRVAVNAPLTFDASVKQWVQLLHGHTLCIVPESVRSDPAAMLAWLETQRVEVLDCTPAQLQPLLAAGLSAASLGDLKAVLVGGDAIDPAMWTTLRGSTRIRVYNVYGPTECTVDATGCGIQSAPEIPVIGRPLENVEAYVLNPRLEPVPIGVDGELFIGGAGVARGYLNMPSATAERFVPHPFARSAGSRLYRTGDRVRRLRDGNLEFLGRLDRQIKIRGYRVEPAEIEAALTDHPTVAAAAVACAATPNGGSRLTAYVVPSHGQNVDVSELRSALREKLPEFMVPDRIARVDSLPLTANAKVDYRALSELALAPPRRTGLAAPRGQLERGIADVWRELLQIDDVAVDDNFFDLGGHSLLLVQLHTRLREALGCEFALVDLFRRPTIASFAAFLAEGADPGVSRTAIAARAERQQQAYRSHALARSKDR